MTYVVTFNTSDSHDDILWNVWYRKLCVLCTDRFEILETMIYARKRFAITSSIAQRMASRSENQLGSATRSSIQYNKIQRINIVFTIKNHPSRF